MPSLYNINAQSPTLSRATGNVNTKHVAAGRRTEYSPVTYFSLGILWALSQKRGQQRLDPSLYSGPRINKLGQLFFLHSTVINITSSLVNLWR
ncbi:hypothetical protein L3X38_011685 [Prunus dulcis]|uniref:Uncharacterized protein n=1 Tax=Prunus dulcis TaxID=3755 RepID=A0AAD4ZFC8_PRUDU|nr:hypothetical protein L3X38_011685 [Prunus dulcis]